MAFRRRKTSISSLNLEPARPCIFPSELTSWQGNPHVSSSVPSGSLAIVSMKSENIVNESALQTTVDFQRHRSNAHRGLGHRGSARAALGVQMDRIHRRLICGVLLLLSQFRNLTRKKGRTERVRCCCKSAWLSPTHLLCLRTENTLPGCACQVQGRPNCVRSVRE